MLKEEYERLCEEREKGYHKEDSGYICNKCGSVVQALFIRVPLHDGFSLFKEHAGGGETIKISVPYCKTCGEEPFEVDCIDV